MKISIFFYETVINHLMRHCFPTKTVNRHSNDKPWVTDWFRTLIRKRQRAHMKGDKVQANVYRNKVKIECPKIPLCVICVHSYTNIL